MAVLASEALCSLYENPNYEDVSSSDWFYDFVKIAWNLGWLDKTKTSFNPNNSITRAEASKILSIALNLTDVIGTSCFSDVSMEDWYAPYIMRLKNRGIVGGYPGDAKIFKPANYINRAEVAKVLELSFHPEDY